ncbi:MAG: glycosyltransferase family 2 protein [Phycisphaerae bacterium]
MIGRNEGERLKRCLRSLTGPTQRIVYVDSGSTDGSVEFARSMGVDVVELDLSKPFTMARGRNAGFERLIKCEPSIDYVQFVDGDCEVVAGWMEQARSVVGSEPNVVAVSGRRRERHPDASIYNRLCDMEWDGSAGEVRSVGGDVMMRAAALQQAGLFNEKMIAGEEPELCVRLRRAGGKIRRLATEMTLHDADMASFGQWWKRAVRGGHAYAEGAALHGSPPERHNVRHVRSAIVWGFCVPLLGIASAVAGALLTSWSWLLCAAIVSGYLLLGIRIYGHRRHQGDSRDHARIYAFFCVLAKFPQAIGIAMFHLNRWRGRTSTLIEYKTALPEVQCCKPNV